ncbi:MAG TPA: SUMF1/EgtB/PvdO family nonheme iron enzyme [Polyangiaceae bacterium]
MLALGAGFARSAPVGVALSLISQAFAACQLESTRGETQAPGEVAPSAAPRASAPAPVVRAASAPPVARASDSMVLSGGVCIDAYEAHLVVPTPGGEEPHPPHLRPANGVEYVARSLAGVRPQAYISRVEAARACENAGERLCTVEEWYGACRGPARTTYPYGKAFERGRCNVGKPHLLTLHFGDDPRAWKYDEHFNSPLLDQLKGYLEPAGHYAGCKGDAGVYDMVGNLHEWVADSVGASLAHKLPLQDGIRRRLRANAGKGVFMGGFFSTTSEHGRGCDFVTIAHEPKYHDYSTGFRCCKEPSAADGSCSRSGSDTRVMVSE